MKKRIISVAIIFAIAFSGISTRLFSIAINPQYASSEKSLRVRTIAEKRGFIYDRNLIPLTNSKTDRIACIIPSYESFNYLALLRGKDFAEKTLGNGYFTTISLEENEELPDSDLYKIFDVYERYSDPTALHILGYTDIDANGVCGVEKYFDNELKAFSGTLSVAYNASATEKMLTDFIIEIRDNNYYEKSGIVLTLDKEIQNITEKAIENGNISKGAAIVLDVKTSAILASASAPIFDRENIAEHLNSKDSPFINRAFTAFPVGSVFKPVTAVAAMEGNIPLFNFNCTGSIEKSNNIFNCNKKDGHGKINFNDAISLSCNPYFIELSTKVGADALLQTASNLGFGKSVDLGNGYLTDKGTLPDLKSLNSDAATGNLGFGQGYLTATPLQIAACFATFANGGIYNEPFLYKGKVNSAGAFQIENAQNQNGQRVLNETTCQIINNALLQTTLKGTGIEAFSSLFNSATKTATAQSGQFDENGNEIKYCWFVGFFPYENPKYVICILKENGSSGGTDGAPVFKEIAEQIYINERSNQQSRTF